MATRQKSTAAASNPGETRLDEHIDAPATTAPGDAPADTTDPTERASTVGGDKAAAAQAGHLTVNAVVPIDENKQLAGVAISKAAAAEQDGDRDGNGHRLEEYPATRPDGTEVRVRHNLDTGETEIV